MKLHEAVNRIELRAKIEAGVRQALKANASLHRLVVHRDGRWWPSEEQGLNEAVAALKREGLLADDCEVCVVEVRKSHLPVRLLNLLDGRGELQNPMPGSYLVLDESQAILTTTGRPGAWDRQERTAGTLLVRIAKAARGMDVTQVAHDVYRLTHLNWNAPEIEISLPATLRWNDDSLRYIAMKSAEESEHTNAEGVETPEGATA